MSLSWSTIQTGWSIDMPYKTAPHKKFCIEYHIQFTTKERRPWIEDFNARDKLEQIFYSLAKEMNVRIKELAIQKDHVHFYISANPSFELKKFMQVIKGKSSYLIKKACPQLKDLPFPLWTKSYFVSTTGPSPNWSVSKYIRRQA